MNVMQLMRNFRCLIAKSSRPTCLLLAPALAGSTFARLLVPAGLECRDGRYRRSTGPSARYKSEELFRLSEERQTFCTHQRGPFHRISVPSAGGFSLTLDQRLPFDLVVVMQRCQSVAGSQKISREPLQADASWREWFGMDRRFATTSSCTDSSESSSSLLKIGKTCIPRPASSSIDIPMFR